MQNDPLTLLFGGQARIRLLRLFLFNPQKTASFNEISRRTKLARRTARTELNMLERAKVVRKKQTFEDVEGRDRKRRVQGYTLNEKFPLLTQLRSFFFATTPIEGKTLMKHLRKAGTFDCVAVSGVFVEEFDRRVDVLVVMKKAQPHKVETAIRSLEAELGLEIKYALLETEDFMYRMGMCDKLTRDVFDYSHHILVDKIGIHDAFLSQ